MALLRAPVRGALLILALALALGAAVPALAADARDPRCAEWEATSPPPGTDMAAVCPPQAIRTETVDLDQEPLLPYIVGLLVMAAVLAVFGVIAMRVTAPKPSRRLTRREIWWSCPWCGVRNEPSRGQCYACQMTREAAASPRTVAELEATEPSPTGQHPA